MGAVCSAPSIDLDLVAIAQRTSDSVQGILANTPDKLSINYDRVKASSATPKVGVVSKDEMLGGTVDVTITEEKTKENALAAVIAGVRMAALGKFIEDMQWTIWVEVSEPIVWKAVDKLSWHLRWAARRLAHKGSDKAVEAACNKAITELCEKLEKGDIPLPSLPGSGGGDAAPAGGSTVQVAPAAA